MKSQVWKIKIEVMEVKIAGSYTIANWGGSRNVSRGVQTREVRENIEASPTFALTTPTYDLRPRVLSHSSRLMAGSRAEIAQKHS